MNATVEAKTLSGETQSASVPRWLSSSRARLVFMLMVGVVTTVVATAMYATC